MSPTDLGFFALIITLFQEALRNAAEVLYLWVFGQLGMLLVFEMARIGLGISVGALGYGSWVGYIAKLIVLTYVIPRWEYCLTTLTTLGSQMGLAATGNRIPLQTFLNPGAYLQLGVDIGGLLYEQWNRSVLATVADVVLSSGMTIGYLVAWLVFLIAFLLMALIIFIAQIEAAFALPCLLVLLPFMAFHKTSWIGQGAATFAIRLAYKFFILALTASIAYPIAQSVGRDTIPDIRQAWMFVFLALTLMACFLYAPALAKNILSGALTLGAGSLANAALLSSHAITAGKTLMVETGRQAWNATGSVLDGATAGRVHLPTIPPSTNRTQVITSLTGGSRYLHG